MTRSLTPGLRLLHRLVLRPLSRDPLRTALTVVSIALGVAVVVAIDLAGRAAAGSFESSVETLSGDSSLTITSTGGVDQELLGKLVRLPYPFHFSPRIEDFATEQETGQAIPFIGLDLVNTSQQQIPAGLDESPGVVNPIFAGSALGWRKGQKIRLLINDRAYPFTVAAVLPKPARGVSENNFAIADIGLAQAVSRKLGRLDSIAVTTPGYGSLAQWEHILRQSLPPSVVVEAAGARTDQNRKMLAAFRWNLRVLSYISLVVGAFLIYNTVAVSVVRRRPEIGVLRALGLSRAGVLAGFLAEATLFGIAGGLLGLLLGRFLALAAVKLIGNTVELLYVSSQPAPVVFNAAAVLSGLALGLGMSIVAALAPALEASRVAPTEAMARGRLEYVARLHTVRNLCWGLGLIAAGIAAALQPPIGGRPLFGYLSAVFLIAATAILIPVFVVALSHLFGKAVERIAGLVPMLALRGLRSSLNRTSVLVGALTTAIAMLCSVGIMVGSFRQTVAIWMDGQLKADFYLRPAGTSAADRHPTIAPAIADHIEKLPGVASVDRFRVYPMTYDGLPASLGGGETTKVEAASATYFLPGENRSRILTQLPQGDNAIVSEPFANKHHVKPGSVLHLALGSAIRPFRVLGIYYDYSTERGFVVMDRHTLLKYLPDPASSNLAVYLKPGADAAAVRLGIERVIRSRGILIFTNAKLRRDALTIFDRTFEITWALEVIAIAVAVMGIAGALLALVIDRKRQFALLQFLGASKSQIRGIIVAEAGLLGLFSNVIGVALGSGLSLILIFVINKQSFGWTIQFHWPVALILLALTGVYLATLLAGLYPARSAAAMNPIEVIHEE